MQTGTASVLVLLSACAASSPAPTTPTEPVEEERPTLDARADAMVRPLVDGARVHGVVVAVRQGTESTIHAFGGVEPGAKLEIGSVTKVYTALLLADAIERGEVAEDATIGDVYEGELPDAVGAITLRALATHSSGLPRLPSMDGSDTADPYAHFDDAHFWAALKSATVGAATFGYSNFGAAILGQLLAAHLDQPYEALVRERILEPLGMADTGFDKDGLVAGHAFYGGDGGPWHLAAFEPAGGLVSTAADQLRFLDAQLSPPDSALGRAIRRSQQTQAPTDSGAIAYGWMVSPAGIRWHNGQTGSFHAFLAFDPESELAVALLADTAAMEVDDAGRRLFEALTGDDVEPPSWPLPRDVPSELMARYEGSYQLAEGFVLTITREGPQLFIQATGQDRFPVYPVGEAHRFELRVTPASGTFELPPTGPATGLTWSQGGRVTRAPRVDP